MGIRDKGLEPNPTRFAMNAAYLEREGKVMQEALGLRPTDPEADLSTRRSALLEQLETLGHKLESRDEGERQAASLWLVRKRKELLALEHPTLNRFIDHLVGKHRPELTHPGPTTPSESEQARPPKPASTLEPGEFATLLALVGPRISDVELDWLAQLRDLGLFDASQLDGFRALQSTSNQVKVGSGNLASLTSVLSRTQLAESFGLNSRMYVVGLGIAANMALGVPSGGLMATSLLGGEGSHWMGQTIAKRAQRGLRDYGADQLEGREVRDEYLVIEDRARRLAEEVAKLPPAERPARLEAEVAVVQQLISSRRSLLERSPGLDRPGETMLNAAAERYASTLTGLAQGSTGDALPSAVHKLATQFDHQRLAIEAAMTIGLDAPAHEHQIAAAILIDRHLDAQLEHENPALARYVRHLIDRKQAGLGDAGDAQVQALAVLAGPEPSVAEINALSRLAPLGVALDQIWPNLSLELEPGKPIDSKQLLAMLDRSDGTALAKLGKWLPTGTNVGAGALLLGILLSGGSVALPLTIAAGVLGLGSTLAGPFLTQRGDTARLSVGVDQLDGRGVQHEFALVLERFRDPRRISGLPDAELKPALAREAGLIEELVRSVATAAQLRGHEYEEDLYARVFTFGARLEELSKSSLEGPALREAVFSAWGALSSPETGRSMMRHALLDSGVREIPQELFAYLQAKDAFITALATLDPKTDPVEATVQLHPLATSLLSTEQRLKMPNGPPPEGEQSAGEKLMRAVAKSTLTARSLTRPSKALVVDQDLQDIATRIAKDPFAPSDVGALRETVADAEARRAKIRTDWTRFATVGKRRAEQIAQHTLNLFWSEAHYRLGGSTELRYQVPKLKQVKARESPDGSGQRDFTVEAKFKAGFASSDGALKMLISANGIPKHDGYSIDLGQRYVADIAERVGRYYAKSVLGDDDAKIHARYTSDRTDPESGERLYQFDVDIRGRSGGLEKFRVEVTGDGFADWSSFVRRPESQT